MVPDAAANPPTGLGTSVNLEETSLIDHFFTSLGVALPIVSKPILMIKYHELRRSPSNRAQGAERALIDIVLAHGAASLPANDQHKIYYTRALNALDGNQLRRTSIELGEQG